MTARSRHHACHAELSRTPPSRCVPGFACTQSLLTSQRHRSSGVGWYPGTSPAVTSLSVVDVVVALSQADLASPSPVASLSVCACVVRAVAVSFSRSPAVSASPPLSQVSFRIPLVKSPVRSGLGSAFGTPTQAPACPADASGFTAFASRGLARRSSLAFTAGVDDKASQMRWCRGEFHGLRPPFPPSSSSHPP